MDRGENIVTIVLTGGKMSSPFTSDEMYKIYSTSVLEVAKALGMEFEKNGVDSIRVKESSGLCIWNHGRGWYHHSSGEGGTVIDFVYKYAPHIDNNFESAGRYIISLDRSGTAEVNQNQNISYRNVAVNKNPSAEIKREKMLPPQKAKNMKRAYAYLMQTRGIDQETINYFVKQHKIFQTVQINSKGYEFSHVAFAGYDRDGEMRFCTTRTTNSDSKFKQDVEGSDKRYSFSHEVNDSKCLFIFESPIDMLSAVTINKIKGADMLKHNLLSLGGVSDVALIHFLSENKQIENLYFCLDNDETGLGQAKNLAHKYIGENYKCKIFKPKLKDFNEDLLAMIAEEKSKDGWSAEL